MHLEAEPAHLNPLQDAHQIIQRVVGGLVYETLFSCTRTEIRPLLAESWELAAEGDRLTVKVKPGIRWHDDRPLTVVDVQASFEPILRSNTRVPALRAMLADVAAVEILPDRVVRIRLHRPSHLVLRALCEVPILPAELLRGSAAQRTLLARQPVGTGPFRVAAWERGKRIRLVPAWPRVPGGGGPPFVDELLFEIDLDGARALSRARRGEIDILPRVLDVHYPEQVAPGALRESLAHYRLTPERMSFLVGNQRREPLTDLRFRRALSLLWDRSRHAQHTQRGLARPIGGPTFGTVGAPAFDKDAAARLLDEAGLRDTDGDGVRDRNGGPIRITLLQPAGARSLVAESRAYANDLRRVGLLLDTPTLDPSALLARAKQGDFDLAPFVWEGQPDEDPRPLFGEGGEFNFGTFRSDRVEALMAELLLADGPLRRRPVLARIAETLAEEQAAIFLYRHDVPCLLAKRIRDVTALGERLDLTSAWLAP